jgi:hypothetical protein
MLGVRVAWKQQLIVFLETADERASFFEGDVRVRSSAGRRQQADDQRRAVVLIGALQLPVHEQVLRVVDGEWELERIRSHLRMLTEGEAATPSTPGS